VNLTFTVFLCLLVPNNASDMPSESVAIVNLQECLKFAPAYEHDKGVLSRDIEATDREAKKLLNQLKKKEALSKRANATEHDHLNARLSSLEFDAFRQREQSRLKDAEEAMFKKWHEQVNAAVKLVAHRKGITVVLYPGTDLDAIEVSANGLQQKLAQTRVGFVHESTRADITDEVIEEMKTAAFVESVEKENNSNEQ
jgi:Skp family chaperone for outer membrane proteins